MPRKRNTAPQSPKITTSQEAPGALEIQIEASEYPQDGLYLVNPHGTIHSVTPEHAAWRLKQPGYRLATEEEISGYHTR
jgi:hypothetical protein